MKDNTKFDFGIKKVFNQLSSGHKIALLVITACVACIVENCILFWDEPENHLHPPLLSALIKALLYLITERNGVAIIATHSPVVLQEVPKSCVWKLRRIGDILKNDRPSIETFGANIGSLTGEVFGLDVTSAAFYEKIKDTVSENDNKIIQDLKNQLGDEAQLILISLLAQKAREAK